MTRFTLALAAVCREHVFTEKWLLAPTLRVGQQWLDNVTIQGNSVLNVRIKTITGMAIDMAGPQMARRGMSFVSDTGSLMLMDRILRTSLSGSLKYFTSLQPDLNFSRAMAHSIRSLKLAGIDPHHMDHDCFEVSDKAADMKSIFTSYNASLLEKGLMDYPDVLDLAREIILERYSDQVPGQILVVIPQEMDLTKLEKAMIQAFPPSTIVSLPPDHSQADLTGAIDSDSQALRWILNPIDAPEAAGDGTANIFSAMGECNEVREALRRCLNVGMALDQVEILHTDVGTYAPLVFEALLRSQEGRIVDFSDLPVTFADGLPARYSRPGRAFSAWIDWIGQGYPQESLGRMLKDGLLRVHQDSHEFSFSELSLTLEKINIGNGLENYLLKIAEEKSKLQTEPSLHTASLTPGGETRASGSPDTTLSRNGATRILVSFLEKLLEISIWHGLSPGLVLDRMAGFMENIARSENELDNYSRLAILAEIREMARWVPGHPDVPIPHLLQWAAALPDEVRVLGSGPRPGRLHVAHIGSGGHSGRKQTFIVGLDDNRFPGSGINDPLLLDGERLKLSQDLPTASSQLSRRLLDFAALLSRLAGTVTLSYSCLDMADDRPMFPSPVVFSAYRIISNNRSGDYTDLMKWLPPPASFAPLDPDQCLTKTEWWHSRLGSQPISDPQTILTIHFPHLGQGMTAFQERWSEQFTIYDGKLPDPPPDIDPGSSAGPVLSANKLETIGKCALSYFFRYILGISKPDHLTDSLTWLDPLKFGTLLHEVFYTFMAQLIEEGRRPHVDRDWQGLSKILEEHVNLYKKRYPPPRQSVLARQERLLRQAALIFLTEEEILCRKCSPRFLETSIGMVSDKSPGSLDQSQPVTVRLAPGHVVRAQGRIDRIDLLADDAEQVFALWDYKTGSAFRYDRSDPFHGGRTLQHALYIEMAALMLRAKVSPRAKVLHFGYFFPGTRSRGARIMRTQELGPAGLSLISSLCKVIAEGCFIATDLHGEDCVYCDYEMICGDVKSISEGVQKKMRNHQNTELDTIRNLRMTT